MLDIVKKNVMPVFLSFLLDILYLLSFARTSFNCYFRYHCKSYVAIIIIIIKLNPEQTNLIGLTEVMS